MRRVWGRCSAGTALLLLVLVSGCGGASDGPTARADAKGVSTVGLLRAVAAAELSPEFVDELRSGGFERGHNVEFVGVDETHPDPADARATVARWVDEGVDLVLAQSTAGALAARAASAEIDILFISNDPTAAGLVESEMRPDGNLTGVTFRVPADRTIAVARRAIPDLDVLGLAIPTQDPAARPVRIAVSSAARDVGLRLELASFSDERSVAHAMRTLASGGVDAVLVANAPAAVRVLDVIQEAADAHRLPLIANNTVGEGALVVLSPDTVELNRQLARQAVRLLSGASVADVPVEDPRRFEFVLNAAKAEELGIALDAELLREATRVVTR